MDDIELNNEKEANKVELTDETLELLKSRISDFFAIILKFNMYNIINNTINLKFCNGEYFDGEYIDDKSVTVTQSNEHTNVLMYTYSYYNDFHRKILKAVHNVSWDTKKDVIKITVKEYRKKWFWGTDEKVGIYYFKWSNFFTPIADHIDTIFKNQDKLKLCQI